MRLRIAELGFRMKSASKAAASSGVGGKSVEVEVETTHEGAGISTIGGDEVLLCETVADEMVDRMCHSGDFRDGGFNHGLEAPPLGAAGGDGFPVGVLFEFFG